jgi:hypothetical protein
MVEIIDILLWSDRLNFMLHDGDISRIPPRPGIYDTVEDMYLRKFS